MVVVAPQVSTFGADQFDPDEPEDKMEMESFFSYFYWSMNAGAFLAFTVVAYLCQYGVKELGR